MNKIFTLIILSCLLISLNASAQKARLGIKSGVNVAWQSRSLEGFEASPVVAMHVTAFTEAQLSKHLFVQPGISLQGKGVSTEAADPNGSNSRVNMMYLEIPINLLYKWTLPNLHKLMIGGGPYAALGLNGKERDGSANVFRGVAGTDGYGNTDFGLNLIAGTELSSRVSLSLQQSIGLDNVSPAGHMFSGPADQPSKADIRNRVSSVSVGYRF